MIRKGHCSARNPRLAWSAEDPSGNEAGQFTAGTYISGDPPVSLSSSSDGGLLGGLAAIAARPLAVCQESMLHPTRLETRTKESNMYASQWALSKPTGAMKVNAS